MTECIDIEATGIRQFRVLSVSQTLGNDDALARILEAAFSRVTVLRTCKLNSAFTVLRATPIHIVFCEAVLSPGSWQEMLDYSSALPNPPVLIVTSRLADERLWAEALNLGAYDVLSKPYEVKEVTYAVASAWRHWENRSQLSRVAGEKGRLQSRHRALSAVPAREPISQERLFGRSTGTR